MRPAEDPAAATAASQPREVRQLVTEWYDDDRSRSFEDLARDWIAVHLPPDPAMRSAWLTGLRQVRDELRESRQPRWCRRQPARRQQPPPDSPSEVLHAGRWPHGHSWHRQMAAAWLAHPSRSAALAAPTERQRAAAEFTARLAERGIPTREMPAIDERMCESFSRARKDAAYRTHQALRDHLAADRTEQDASRTTEPAELFVDDPAAADNTAARPPPVQLAALSTVVLTAAPPPARVRAIPAA